jgi:hypothetical protein
MEDHAIYGWENIGKVFGVSGKKMREKHKEELMACGAVFFILVGRPPVLRVAAFPSFLKSWASLKGSKGEIL